jgi:ribonuclease BN (tRNA processing enzyme)
LTDSTTQPAGHSGPGTDTETDTGSTAPPIRLTFLGCGDAFGSGGRLHTCMHVHAGNARILIDCGASSLIGMKRLGVDPLSIQAVCISHFHADHFAGLPFLLLESKARQRTAPLTIAGPPGIATFLDHTFTALFPGSTPRFPFAIEFVEYSARKPVPVLDFAVTAFPVPHVPETMPHGVRLDLIDRVIAYSGDTEWTDTLHDIARNAHVFVCESSMLDAAVPGHLDYATIRRHRPDLECQRLILTHMGPDVLAAADSIAHDAMADMAADGATFRL